ncbi:MAG: UTP--glucose-1-phosphate uridylyltransferase [Myxococcota bacterium]|nr:UTP--glucose-1-phosphate uridylyltransferase [Myxococcota bacterium]MDW8363027.1 UTP--glucose-1-phosphate uridylyltransferase [Myxococcales bacterium]
MTEPATTVLDESIRRLLVEHDFDPSLFERLQAAVREGRLVPGGQRVQGCVEPPDPVDVTDLGALGAAERERFAERGLEAFSRGEVASVVLAGGMATRFGGVVKALVEACPGRRFVDVKLADARRMAERCGARLPVLLMTSASTHAALEPIAEDESSARVPIRLFRQQSAPRLRPDGSVLLLDGQPSLAATGHGDLTFALRRSGLDGRLRAEGVRWLVVTNVDNVAATLDPVIVGAHLESGAPLSCEVVAREPTDRGGAPVRVEGRIQLVEAFRMPEGFDAECLPVFNTNSFVMNLDVVEHDFPLTWLAVSKTVQGEAAIQLERLVGELTAFVPTRFWCVPRSGSECRFLPVKDAEEHARRRDDIERVLRARGLLTH